MYISVFFVFLVSFVTFIWGSNVTESCTEFEKAQHSLTLDQCEIKSDSVFAEKISNGESDLHEAYCINIKAKSQCLEDFFKSCYDPKSATRGLDNYIYKQAELAINKTELLGPKLIQSCSVFQDFEEGYMVRVTGSNQCSFLDYVSKYIPEKKACDEKVENEMLTRLQISALFNGAARRELVLSAVCEAFDKYSRICRNPLTDTCYTFEETQKLIAFDYKNYYSKLEKDLQKNFDPSFTFKETCPILEADQLAPPLSRRKRSANPSKLSDYKIEF